MNLPCASIGRYRNSRPTVWFDRDAMQELMAYGVCARYVEWQPYRRRKQLLRTYYRGAVEAWVGEEPPDELVNLWKEDALQHEGDRV